MASKLQDIYYIDISQIEFDEACQQKISRQEKTLLEQLDYRLCSTTELDFMFDYLALFLVPDRDRFFKRAIRNLLIIMRDG